MQSAANLPWIGHLRDSLRRVDWAGLGLFAVSLTVYIRTLAPGVLPSDYGEFQFKIYTLDPIHPPGYPLYLLAGRVWLSLVPFGSVAYRVNLFSAVCAAVAVWFLYRFIRQLLQAKTPALAGAGLLAFAPLFWTYAITAGTYALHALLFSALLYLWLLAYDQQRPLGWAAFVFGLGLAHHRLIVISAPVFFAATWMFRRLLLPSRRAWLQTALALLLPLTLYGVLIWQGVWPLPVFLRHVMISGGAVYPVQGFGAIVTRLLHTVWPWLHRDFGVPLTLVGLGTLIMPLRLYSSACSSAPRARLQRIIWLLLGLLLSHLVFFSLVRIEPDDLRYFLPAYALIAIGIAIAVGLFQAGLGRYFQKASALAVVALLLPGFLVYRHLPEMAGRYDDYYERLSRDAFRTVEQDAVIVARWPYAMPLLYFQAVERWRPDVQVLMPGQDASRTDVITWIEAGRPVYFRERLFGLDWPESGYLWVHMNVGGLYRALPAAPPMAHWISVDDGAPFKAVGLSKWPLEPDALVIVSALWGSEAVKEGELGLLVRLLDERQHRWGEWSAPLERLQLATDTDGTVQADLFLVTPPALPPGEYALELGLSHQSALLTSLFLPGVPVAPKDPPPPLQRLVVSDWVAQPERPPHDLRLTAVDWPGRRFSENTLITLSLFWQVLQSPTSPSLSLYLASDDQRWPLIEASAVLENTLTTHLPVDTLLESRHNLSFASVRPGRYRVEAEVNSEAGGTHYDLGRITVDARERVYRVPPISRPFESTLGGEIELLGYDLASDTWSPGQQLALTLYWRALTQPEGDYKVFTHLMDPQGGLAAQKDDLPVRGMVLTSHWSPKEVFTDQYIVSLPLDLSEGTYQLEVGMYHPDTGERLVAVDAAGNRWSNDKIVLQQVQLEREEP